MRGLDKLSGCIEVNEAGEAMEPSQESKRFDFLRNRFQNQVVFAPAVRLESGQIQSIPDNPENPSWRLRYIY